jgi:hypothetical protein
MVKLRKVEMGRAWSKCGKMRTSCVFLKRKSVWKKQFGRSICRQKNDVKMHLMCEALGIIHLGQDKI